MSNKTVLSLGNATFNNKIEHHTPSTIQADTLFTFTSELKFLYPIIENRMISPRYCIEDVTYLNLNKIHSIAYPMKCFCDINLHRINEHMEWYGYYGVAFKKEWGMKKGIQPIHYINPYSALCKDFTEAFNYAIKPTTDLSQNYSELANFILNEMMYYKPYQGKMENRITKNIEMKCFTDECEWRFVPDVTKLKFKQAYYTDKELDGDTLKKYSDSIENNEDVSIQFEYNDLKYVIVKSLEDFSEIIKKIKLLNLDEITECDLISKIIIWDNSKEDF